MANIPLRAYLREIEGLIDSGQLEETVAHCRYILQKFPKHVDTYRLLGKVFLEGKQFTNAADILQRVLSAVPDDFVSHVGMSIIREDEGNLDGAIWHMERAFESQPSNKAIQDELRRLFGRRDGMEPPKIRLTRGALARLYAKGNLYDQATAELRGALSEDPQRPDLQLLLAQMNYLAGNRVDAVETSSSILKKFPHCLMANRILALILPQTERASDAKIYQQRAFALDPYLTKAGMEALTSEEVPDSSIMIETLERQPGQPIEGLPEQPAWAATLGIKFDGTGDEELPDWLSEEMVIPSYEGQQVAPFVVDEAPEEPETGIEPAEELIPEWMQEAGWQPSTGEAEELPTSEEPGEVLEAEGEIEKAEIPDWLREIASVEEVEVATTVEVIPEDALPPWLDETPPGPTDSIISWLDEKESEETIETELSPEISEETIETEPSPEIKEEVEIPEWLQELDVDKGIEEDLTPEMQIPSIESLEEIEEQDTEKEEELPEWLKEPTEVSPISAETEEFREPQAAVTDDWLKENETEPAPEVDIEEASEEKPEAPGLLMEEESGTEEIEIPDWLKSMDKEVEGEQLFDEALQEKTEIPEWLQELGEIKEGEKSLEGLEIEGEPEVGLEPEDTASQEFQAEQEIVPEKTDVIEQEMQDAALAWLESLAAKQGVSEEELITKPEERLETPPEWIIEEEMSAESAAEIELPEGEITGEAVLPEWLQEVEETKEEEISSEPDEAEGELPAWVRDLDQAEIEPEEPTLDEAAIESPEVNDEDAGLAWLESLAAKQGVSEEELITHPEDRLIEPPPWVREEAELSTEISLEETLEQEMEIEVPEREDVETWVSEISDRAVSVEEGIDITPQVTEVEEFEVDLNTGSLSELESIPGVGFVLAQSIIEYRDTHGPFHALDELKNVPGIDNQSFEYIKDRLSIQATEEAPKEAIEIGPEGMEEEDLVKVQSAEIAGELERSARDYDQLIKNSDNIDEVIAALLADITNNPENILLWQALGDAYMRNDQFQKALEAYTKAEKLL